LALNAKAGKKSLEHVFNASVAVHLLPRLIPGRLLCASPTHCVKCEGLGSDT
jgi:hypothetical protein